MKKKKLHFVSGNKGKFGEVRDFFAHRAPEINVVHTALDVDEIQSLDLKTVALAKAKSAWKSVQKPLIIDDGGCYLDAYNNFPGALSKFVMQGIGIEGIFKLAEKNPKATFRNFIVFIDGPDSYKLFEGVCPGTLVKPKGLDINPDLPWRAYFKPDGSEKTYDELLKAGEQHAYHHRIMAMQAFVDWYRGG